MSQAKMLKLTLFGESHGSCVGVTLEGFPPGLQVDESELRRFLRRRSARADGLTTSRIEADEPQILSGIYQGRTTGTPVTAIFPNQNQHSSDYDFLPDCPRPGHADYPAWVQSHGCEDLRGGGYHSGRLTLPYAFAGGLALQYLSQRKIRVGAHLLNLGGIADEPLDELSPDWEKLYACHREVIPALRADVRSRMEEAIRKASAKGDSLGGVVECMASGLPVGLPHGGKLDSRLGEALFAIPAVKGMEIGAGFASAGMSGSAFNDPYTLRNGKVTCTQNHAGGILGGMSNGMPLLVRAAFRPTPSIALEQDTVNLAAMENTKLQLKGRHDPCVALRAVPVVEAAVALTLMDALLSVPAMDAE